MTDDEPAADPASPEGSEVAIRSQHDWAVDSTSGAVVAAVAVAADRDPLALAPLYERVDPEALDDLFSPRPGGGPAPHLCVTIDYDGYEVTVEGDGTVTVRDGDRPVGPDPV